MRPTYYLRKFLGNGNVERVPFDASHFIEVGVLPAPLAGMPQLEAYQLVNKWNKSQTNQTFVYALD